MEREILFRGKSVNTGEWLFGDIMYYAGSAQIWYQTEDGKWNSIVNPATVGQYTGLTDKNGVKIFEGDILSTSNSNCRIWYVDFKPTAFCANQSNANYSCVLDDFITTCEVEVIGNIHDSPELLEVKA